MSKKKQGIWQLCDICSRLFYFRQLEDHTALCDGTSDSKHAHIQGGVFHAVVVNKSEKIVAESKFPLSSRNDVVLVNINTMKTCGMCIGGKIVVQSPERETVCIVWPSTGVTPECVALTPLSCLNCKVSPGYVVEVSKLMSISIHAEKVQLHLCADVEFEINQMFTNYCLRELDGHYISVDDMLEVQYYGKKRALRVASMTGSFDFETLSKNDNELNPANCDEEKLAKTLGSLNISTAPDNRLSCQPGDRIPEQAKQLTCNSLDTKESNDGQLVRSKTESGQEEATTVTLPEKTQILSDPVAGNVCERTVHTESKSSRSNRAVYYISADETYLFIQAHGVVMSQREDTNNQVTFSSVGGLQQQVSMVQEMVELPLKHPELFSSYGITPPRGVLLYGPSGTGKTLIARAVANECGVHFICINGPDILSRYYGETEARLRDIFQQARERAPSIVFFDELDALCPKRDKVQNEFEKRVVATLLTLMDGIDTVSSSGHVLVLAATNRPDALDSALRRPGRFDREIEIGIPNTADRQDILRTLLRNVPHNLREEDLTRFAESAHGYVGADLAAVCKEAGLLSFKRCLGDSDNIKSVDPAVTVKSKLLVTEQDLRTAFGHVRPSAMREVSLDIPKVRWNDIGGNSVVKQKLKEAVEWPLRHPEVFKRMGIRPPKGILMYGPPGCSKTMIARALATESGLNFLAVKGPELFSKWVGESENAVREVFRKARAAAPSIVFFDEIDALAVQRGSSGEDGGSSVTDRVLTQLLTELDGVETLKDVVMVAATNRPDMIDPALLRPGRIDRVLYVPIPDQDTRREVLQIHLSHTPVGDDVRTDELVERTHGFSGAEISAVCREAALAALQEDINAAVVRMRHFDKALLAVKPRLTHDLLQFYENYQTQSGVHSI